MYEMIVIQHLIKILVIFVNAAVAVTMTVTVNLIHMACVSVMVSVHSRVEGASRTVHVLG